MSDPKVNKAVIAKAVRHMNHHGGGIENWYVGIEEGGSDRDNTGGRHPMRYELANEDVAKLTMSALLTMGLMADDEYGADPKILFIYLNK